MMVICSFTEFAFVHVVCSEVRRKLSMNERSNNLLQLFVNKCCSSFVHKNGFLRYFGLLMSSCSKFICVHVQL